MQRLEHRIHRARPFAAAIVAIVGLALPQIAAARQPTVAPSKAPETAPAKPAQGTPQPAAAPDPYRFGTNPKDIRPKPDGAIRIATYNVENLFDDKDDPALSGQYEDKDNTKPAAHCRAAADAIRKLNPDVIALDEIESEQAVLWFRDQYLSDMGYKYVASIDAGDERGIEQSVLSRFPITEAKNWPGAPLDGVEPEKVGTRPNDRAGKPMKLHRSPLCVTVTVPTPLTSTDAKPYTLTLFAVHQKSGKDYEYFRAKEAAKTVELIAEIQKTDPNRNVVVLGDFNSTDRSASMKVYGDFGMIDLFGDADPKDPKVITHESGRRIDRIFVTPSLAKEIITGSAFVLSVPARPAGADWRNTAPPDGYASDHYPVAVDIIPVDK